MDSFRDFVLKNRFSHLVIWMGGGILCGELLGKFIL